MYIIKCHCVLKQFAPVFQSFVRFHPPGSIRSGIAKRMHRTLLLAVLVVLAAPVAALLPAAGRSLSATRPAAVSVRMGPAEDGPFTPLCLAGKVVLGQTTFNKYRGKIISIHSG